MKGKGYSEMKEGKENRRRKEKIRLLQGEENREKEKVEKSKENEGKRKEISKEERE